MKTVLKTKTQKTSFSSIAAGILLLGGLFFLQPSSAGASSLDTLKSGSLGEIDASADSYEYLGDNIIARGHVVIRYQNMQISAEKAIVNIKTQDLEAVGNVTFASRETISRTVDMEEYRDLNDDPDCLVEFVRYTTSPTGRQMIEVNVTKNSIYLKADRAAGNLITGVIQFKDFAFKSGVTYCTGASAERTNDGTITVKGARVTTCDYIMDNHDHYAITSGTVVIMPRDTNHGLFNYNPDHGEHSIWAYNNFLRLWNIPVFWFPALYKPADSATFGGKVEFGNSSDFGYYVRTSKGFQLLNDPYLNANVMLDYYQDRGFGYGINGDLITPESSTDFFFYGISDKEPYNYWDNDSNDHTAKWKKNNSRLKIPKYRYELKLSNVTHVTPRLDFRGQLDLLSDYNFLNDFFEARYNRDIQPPTYAGAEYQFDRLSASIYLMPRINSFYSSVERLPEMRLDFPRQELFANIYYQGSTTMEWLNMRWRDYDRKAYFFGNPIELKDYNTARFDTLHMFYYPFKIASWLNVIPRAGVRMTAYSRTSKKSIGYEDLSLMFMADSMDSFPYFEVENYDGDGGAKLRITGEIGLEANTKIYKTWQNVKNAYWELDGLRHVMVPYINYTYIPQPNVSRDKLFYFDDVDRLDEQHFIRFGLVNRLQTRRNDRIVEWMSLENYWDFHIHDEKHFNHIGDLGTIFRFTPFEGLTFTSDLLLDLGQSDDHDVEAERGDRLAGRPGVSWKLIDRWYNTLSYSFAKDWRIFANYIYSDAYNQRSTYSMGSMLTRINATSAFETAFDRHQSIGGGIEFPFFYEYTKLKGIFLVSYDIDAALMRNVSVGFRRNFHCWDLYVEVGREGERAWDSDKEYSHYISFYLSLTAMPGARLGTKVDN